MTIHAAEMVQVARFELAVFPPQTERDNQITLYLDEMDAGARVELAYSPYEDEGFRISRQ